MPIHELAWTEGARCADKPLEFFYTDRAPGASDAAMQCCNAAGGCPARRQCLVYAIAHVERDGTWGGMLSKDRDALARTRCPNCRTMVGRQLVAQLVANCRQHVRCATCRSWVEVRPDWERPHRNNHITGTGRRT